MQDVLVIGGGCIGLAIALELRLQGASVTVVTRRFAEAATHAAAGMLAPQAEALPPGPMLNLCLQSRALYADWVSKIEHTSGQDAGYWACGILAPEYAVMQPPAIPADFSLRATWLDQAAVQHHQPGLSTEVVGGWWYPDDAQVDNRLLARALWAAAQTAGVELHDDVTVNQIHHHQQQVAGVETSMGSLQAGHYVLATGAWSQALLPIPVVPRKGQMLSVQSPTDLPLQHVLFGRDIYIVPRRDGRIVIGATSEDVGFTPHNTPAGIQSLLAAAMRLYPPLRSQPIQELWWGFRPATPDECPILGASPYNNLTVATGHYRNGILLTPITARLIAQWITQQQQDPLLDAFSWSRFSTPAQHA